MANSRVGGLWITNVPTAVSTTTVPTKLTAWVNEGTPVGHTTVDADAGTVVIKTPGWYLAHCSLSFDGDRRLLHPGYHERRKQSQRRDKYI